MVVCHVWGPTWALNLDTFGGEIMPIWCTSHYTIYGVMRCYNSLAKNGSFYQVHSKLRSITPMVTKVYVILQIFVVLTWMHDTIELV